MTISIVHAKNFRPVTTASLTLKLERIVKMIIKLRIKMFKNKSKGKFITKNYFDVIHLTGRYTVLGRVDKVSGNRHLVCCKWNF